MSATVHKAFLDALRPMPRVLPSDWAAQYLVLPQSGNARPGKFTPTVPQKGMIDAVAEPGAKVVVYMLAAQVGKTSAIMSILGHAMAAAPCPILHVSPDSSAADSFVKDRLDPTIAATPALRSIVGAGVKGQDSKSAKTFAGGTFHTASSWKASDLAGRSVKLLLLDELSRFCPALPGEGDPVTVSMKRTTAWRDAVTVMASTPTFRQTCRINAWYERSDKRQFHVTCEHCQSSAPLAKERLNFEPGKPHTARLACLDCGVLTDEAARLRMLRKGEWRATATSEPGVIGFQASSLISEFETLESIARNVDAAKTPDQKRVLTNTTFGEAFESTSEIELAPGELQALAMPLQAPFPKEIDFFVAGVDVQTNRLEVSFCGVNKKTGEKWIVSHDVLAGDSSGPTVWADLDRALARTFRTEDGRELPISAALVDGGFNTGMVVSFVSSQRSKGRRVFVSKGVSGFHQAPIREGSKNRGATHRVMLIGIDGLKVNVQKGLTLPVGTPNAIHTADHMPSDFWAQLASERLDVAPNKRGFTQMQWIKDPGTRNEAFDTAVLCSAAALLVTRPASAVNAKKAPTITLAERVAKMQAAIHN